MDIQMTEGEYFWKLNFRGNRIKLKYKMEAKKGVIRWTWKLNADNGTDYKIVFPTAGLKYKDVPTIFVRAQINDLTNDRTLIDSKLRSQELYPRAVCLRAKFLLLGLKRISRIAYERVRATSFFRHSKLHSYHQLFWLILFRHYYYYFYFIYFIYTILIFSTFSI